MSSRVVFLDRDGTVILEPVDERVDKIEKIQLFPDTLEALRLLADNDFSVVFITNQSGISEGRISESDFWNIHSEVLRMLSPSGVKILKTYVNGENQNTNSQWRKPGPKMLLNASDELGLDLSQIYMIGDRETDVLTGINASCKGSILISRSGKKVRSEKAVFTATSLLEAVKFVISN